MSEEVEKGSDGRPLTPPVKSRGLGDSIKKVTSALGIKQCGACKKRQKKLNRLFPYDSNDKKEP